MEDMESLRNVLDRIEGKLIAAGKMYGALNFGVWLSIMLLYYVIIGIFDPVWQFNLVYWPVAFGVAMYLTGRLWKRLKALGRVAGREAESSTLGGILIGVSWIVGLVLGWFVIPQMHLGINGEASLAVGFLSFIAISTFGMWLVFTLFGDRDLEMIPAFLLPAIGVPIAMNMSAGSMVWAGFLVALGFSMTVILYLYDAFRAIEG